MLTVGGAALALQGHAPYRQWHVFRKSRLIIVASAEDPAAVRAAEAVAAVLATHLAGSRAMMTRARDIRDVVSLLATGQLDLGLVAADEARVAHEGRTHVGRPVPLRALASLGAHVLVCREELPGAPVRAIVEALAEQWEGHATEGVGRPARPDAAGPPAVPAHAAAGEYWRSRPAITPAAR